MAEQEQERGCFPPEPPRAPRSGSLPTPGGWGGTPPNPRGKHSKTHKNYINMCVCKKKIKVNAPRERGRGCLCRWLRGRGCDKIKAGAGRGCAGLSGAGRTRGAGRTDRHSHTHTHIQRGTVTPADGRTDRRTGRPFRSAPAQPPPPSAPLRFT